MSDEHDDDFNPNYRNPPVEYRFKPGQSGNPRGRPVKRERSLTSLQTLRDTLAVTNAKIKVRTVDGLEERTVHQALILKAAQMGLAGHAPMLRFSILRHESFVRTHELRGEQYFPMLDKLEQQLALHPPSKEYKNANEARLNEWRKDTQRT